MISVVIPTRNRLDSLNRVLDSLYNQTLKPNEIIIVDSSDQAFTTKDLIRPPQSINLILEQSTPSVCEQRNIGIKLSSNPIILLSDDDLVFEEEYTFVLYEYLKKHPSKKAASGIILEKNKKNEWAYANEISDIKLFYNWFFGLSIFSDLSKKKRSSILINGIKTKLTKKGNRISKAGWPIFVNWDKDENDFPFFSLMGAMIRKPEKDLFDPVFIFNGIGDNYDACIKLGFNITILKKSKAFHHKEIANRINPKETFYYRTSALHYILLNNSIFSSSNRFFLLWSLIGVLIPNLLKMDLEMIKYNLILIFRILFKKNLYQH
ncbi:glycosyltransferase family 2 protein [uncultured Aquimarina sp.]|uniref:glycosyltransferase family 2 protein n=1 Tax=uncultured Aquimarina sp. TaxID=575652 RepID=UPI00261A3578|nr:glycosyltransferase family 2 protein [uncultured Aquimarina sp.]